MKQTQLQRQRQDPNQDDHYLRTFLRFKKTTRTWTVSTLVYFEKFEYLNSAHKQAGLNSYLPEYQDNYDQYRHDQLDPQEYWDIQGDYLGGNSSNNPFPSPKSSLLFHKALLF